jgi:hypothetical protein
VHAAGHRDATAEHRLSRALAADGLAALAPGSVSLGRENDAMLRVSAKSPHD